MKPDGAAAVKRLRDLAAWHRGCPAEAKKSAERWTFAAILERMADEEERRMAAEKEAG